MLNDEDFKFDSYYVVAFKGKPNMRIDKSLNLTDAIYDKKHKIWVFFFKCYKSMVYYKDVKVNAVAMPNVLDVKEHIEIIYDDFFDINTPFYKVVNNIIEILEL